MRGSGRKRGVTAGANDRSLLLWSGRMSEAPAHKILIVEDDPALATGLCDALEFEGFRVVHARTGEEGIAAAAREHPECILLDLMLPDLNGYQVCSRIRDKDAHVPIIMLTARSQEADKIRGLEAGADDYVTKPFSIGELIARIRAIFRRAHRVGAGTSTSFQIGDATIDPANQTLTNAGGTHELSSYEVQLLQLLYDRRGKPVTRDEILERVWGVSQSSTSRTVDNFVVKLRKKIEPIPDKPHHIRTVYGVGYKLVL
jgi:DNA-binding response OmpR family regulator